MDNTNEAQPDISRGMVLLLAIACGAIVANIYYAQTLVGPIAAATGLSDQAAGLIVTLTQAGYAAGLLFIVPLGDLLENRRLVVSALGFTALALGAAAVSSSRTVFLAASLAIGLGSVAAQVLVPFAAHLAREETRGRTVGRVVGGLLTGVMLARPAASLVADRAGWHAVFGIAAALTLLLAVVLRLRLPRRAPVHGPARAASYPRLIGSLWRLFASTALLRRRAAYHAALFGAFSLFWTVAPLMLAGPAFRLSQTGIAVFALVGMAGAVASPLAGRLADAGHTLPATGAALLLSIAGFALPLLVPAGGKVGLALLVLASIVLDMAVAANLVLGQRAIFGLGAEVRSRLNGIYFALFFAGGALGSALGAWIYARHGWHGALLAGLALPLAALLYWSGEWAAMRRGAGRPARTGPAHLQ